MEQLSIPEGNDTQGAGLGYLSCLEASRVYILSDLVSP